MKIKENPSMLDSLHVMIAGLCLLSGVGCLQSTYEPQQGDMDFEIIGDYPAYMNDLETLNLPMRSLTNVPDLSKLTNLRVLILDTNRLTKFPAGAENLPLLTEVYLGNNKIESLPDEIGNMLGLKILGLEHNNLTSVPESIYRLVDTIESINLVGNDLPAEVKMRLLAVFGDKVDLDLDEEES